MGCVAIIGGGGMLGQKLVRSYERDPGRNHGDILLCDRAFPKTVVNAVQYKGDFSHPELLDRLLAHRPDTIFHLAAVVSGQAEQEFDLGWSVNVDGTRALLEGLRRTHDASGQRYRPRVVFTSSLAVFGPPYPDRIPDDFHTAPLSSYGAQKAMGELMVTEFSRKGFIDGICLRLPTIVVRPGVPNKAASSFFSGIIREPLNGQPADLPVPDAVRHWLASPRAAVGYLRHAAAVPADVLSARRVFNLPGVSCTVAEQIESLRRYAGQSAVDLIRTAPDEMVRAIVHGWPRAFDPQAALALGFRGDQDFDSILHAYVEDDLALPDHAPG